MIELRILLITIMKNDAKNNNANNIITSCVNAKCDISSCVCDKKNDDKWRKRMKKIFLRGKRMKIAYNALLL